MTIEQLSAANQAQPFQRFVVLRADGREIPVLHREFLLTVPNRRSVVMCHPDSAMNIVDPLLVTDLEIKPQLATTAN